MAFCFYIMLHYFFFYIFWGVFNMLNRIYDDGELRFTLHTPEEYYDPNVLVITFQSLNGKISDHGFGTDFLLSCGYKVIFVSHKGRSHYQKLSLELFRDIVGEYISNKEIFLYGSSTGGYAAIYYSGVVNGQSICLSPRCDIDPIYNPGPELGEFRHLVMNDIPYEYLSETPPIVAYDPFVAKDNLFILERLLPVYPKAQIWKIPNAFHPVGPAMKNAGVLKKFVLDAIKYKRLTQEVLIDPKNSPKYLLKTAEEELKNNNKEGFNNAVLGCLSLGGHRALFPLMSKALSKKIISFNISKEQFPESMVKSTLNKFLSDPSFNSDLRQSNQLIKLSLYVFDFQSALFLLDVKVRISGDSKELKALRNKVISCVNYLKGLPKCDFDVE